MSRLEGPRLMLLASALFLVGVSSACATDVNSQGFGHDGRNQNGRSLRGGTPPYTCPAPWDVQQIYEAGGGVKMAKGGTPDECGPGILEQFRDIVTNSDR